MTVRLGLVHDAVVVARYFTLDYREPVVLRDGTRALLRLLRPDDKPLLRAGFAKLSDDSRYARFFAAKTQLTDRELDYLCNIDQERHFALGALDEATGSGLGIARFIVLDTPDLAEAAVTITDDAQGKGLGRLLFLRLCAAATERGVTRFRCDVLATNNAMAGLIDAVAPDRHVETADGVMTIDLAVPAIAPTEPATTQPTGGMYRLLRAVAERIVSIVARKLRSEDG